MGVYVCVSTCMQADVSKCIEVLKLMITKFEFIVFFLLLFAIARIIHIRILFYYYNSTHVDDVSAAALTHKQSQTRRYMKKIYLTKIMRTKKIHMLVVSTNINVELKTISDGTSDLNSLLSGFI